MENNKMTISRSYTRKVNLGNYQSEDFFSSWSEEIPVTTTIEEMEKRSKELFLQATIDTLAAVQLMRKMRDKHNGKLYLTEFQNMLTNVRKGVPIYIGDYDKLNPDQLELIQDAKRAHKRDKYKEEKEIKNGV